MQQSIYVEGFAHGNPIPAGCRIGNLPMTGVISAKDARTGKRPESLAAQVAAVFRNAKDIVEAGGMTTANILKMTVWLKDPSDRSALNAEWTRMFPDPAHRPARMVMPLIGDADALILCDVTAVA